MRYKVTYQPARLSAKAIEAHFVDQMATMQDKDDIAPLPFKRAIEVMLDVVFWASLRKEEGHSPKISIAFLPPESALQPLKFNLNKPLSTEILTKLAPAVEQPGIHLAVWHEKDRFYIWGATRELPELCFVLEVIEPGAIVVKHRRLKGFGKFYNVAILHGDEIKIIEPDKAISKGCSNLISSIFDFSTPGDQENNLLLQLAIAIRAHKKGGILLIVPSNQNSWKKSIIHPVQYLLVPPFSKLKQILQGHPEQSDEKKWSRELQLIIEGIAGLTAVDGAMIMNDQYEIYAFGAKIGYSSQDRVKYIRIIEPIKDHKPTTIHSAEIGGTRHLSAAQFAYDQPDSIALVASQDGKFTIFSRSSKEDLVYAHRIDALLF